ncbi:hypothetical protein [Oxalobacter paraformigenes]|uniref:Uncharacterized protein n=1 Tax=Oxalobacter paraformigenes TaxID=556268 RepID=C3X373_9BURK|nr:hypothetical protein [Oxalobacter paraformigenes]EEO27659.1 hypothetical protein OFAG_00812 [Oxalobacter paraformigenes]
MEIGQKARLIQPVIQGEIIDTEYDKDAKELRHLLVYEDTSGTRQQRWFLESQLEEVK